MQKIRRITAFLNIEPGEERLIGLLILLYFILALGFVFVQSMAFGIFLGEYGVDGLPYSYIVIAVLASLVAAVYISLGGRVSFSKLLFINLIFLAGASLLIWVALSSPLYHVTAFILPLWFQIAINLGNLAVWPLAGSLFDFRQGKRLFPLLAAGNWLANIIGGLFIPPLVKSIGTTNLLLLGGLSFGAGLFVLHVIVHSYVQTTAEKPKTRRTRQQAKSSPGIFKDRYVRLIFAYTILWWVAFFFVDNIFYNRAFAQYPDADQLTAFMGRLISMMGIVALISSTVIVGRLIARFGLRVGLLVMPVIVILSLSILAFSGSLGAPLLIVFMLGSFAKLINVALGFSLSQSANAIIYQSLPDTVRGRIQATAEGIVQPIAIGIAGLSLLALTAGLKLNYIGLAYVFLGLGVVWLIVIFLLSGDYVRALTRVITKRRLGDDANVLADPVSIALLRGRLHDSHAGVVIYSLNKLEALDEQSILTELPNLIRHPVPEVRREAFSHIETSRLRAALNPVSKQLSVETTPSVKESGLRALGAIADPESCTPLLDALHETETHVLRGALIGSLKYQQAPLAEQTLQRLLTSASTADRILAAQVLGEADRTQFAQSHQILLRDPEPMVRREALHSVARSRQPFLYPLLIEGCDSPETSHAAALALLAIGPEIFPEIKSAFSQPNAPRHRLLTLPKVMARTGGSRAYSLLRSRIDSSDSELRSQILNALDECGYHTGEQADLYSAIKREVQATAWVCAAQVDLGNTEATALLSAALGQFNRQTRDRVLLLLSFLFDAKSILRVREALSTDSPPQLAYALEIIDAQLPSEWKSLIIPLLEELSPQDRLQHLSLIFPQAPQTIEDRLRTLIDEPERGQFTDWIRACAIYTAAELGAQSCYELIHQFTTHSSGTIRDTARWAVARLSKNNQKGNNPMLSTIEKVLILKTVNMFNQTPDNVLADVANLLEEMEVAEDETIFKKGELGDSMYIIVDGKVRVHTDERFLNYLGESDVFGEMALLDPEPRLASVTAVESTRLFRLDQAPFYQLMSERPEVATGIIRVLTRLLRDRVRDVSQLDSRVKELEHMANGNSPASA